MKISLDFDGTYAADPKFWSFFAADAVVHGHSVITVTHRRKTFENEQHMRGLGVNWLIVFAYDKPKKLAAIEAGHQVDIWIDDNPQGIGTGGEDLSTHSVFEIELRNAHNVLKNEVCSIDSNGLRLIERLETVLEAS